jgi:predicted DNA-binding transcriptional regulator YafY
MRRADRLFQIIQILRRKKLPVTAARLAEELEVSKRTIYRDIADLAGQRVPVEEKREQDTYCAQITICPL